MISATLTTFMKQSAGRSLGLRGGMVAGNFMIMMGLAAGLGLDVFGQLVFIWGAALVAGTALSIGGPLVLLRGLTDGQGMRLRDVAMIAFLYPLVLALIAYWSLSLVWPDLPWLIILVTGFGTNLVTCLASIMRAMGSLHWSMVLRDAGPQAALGLGAVLTLGQGAAAILLAATAVMVAICCLATVWCCRMQRAQAVFSGHKRKLIDPPLWGTSVLGMVITQMDLIVGGMVMSDGALGTYAVLRRIANLVALPVTVATWISAPQISAAFGKGDAVALQQASTAGSQIALLPGAMLFLLGVTTVPVLLLMAPGAATVFTVLLIGAFIQVFFASGFTVATLCGQAHRAAFARFAAFVGYVLGVQFLGAGLSPVANAVIYTTAMSAASVLLWAQLKRTTAVETSGYALWRTGVGAWKTS